MTRMAGTLLDRGRQLALSLSVQAISFMSRWNPLATCSAGFYLNVLVATVWLASLYVRPRAVSEIPRKEIQ